MAEIAIDTDVNLRILALKLGKNVGQQVEASGFVGAEDDGSLYNVAAIGNNLDGFVAEAEQAFGIVEKNFTRGGEFDRFSRAIEEFGAIGLFKLANLGADGGLGAKNFLTCA